MGSLRPVHSAHVGIGGWQPHLTVEGLAAFFDTKCKPDVCRSFRFRNVLFINGLTRAEFIVGPQPLGRLPFTTSSVIDVGLPGAPPPGSKPWKPFTTMWLLRGVPGDNEVDVLDICCSPSVTGPLAARICLYSIQISHHLILLTRYPSINYNPPRRALYQQNLSFNCVSLLLRKYEVFNANVHDAGK
jgi:hypothetical protein